MTRSRARASIAALLSLACVVADATHTTTARADDAARKAAAQQLFDEALKLMDQGKYAEACTKFGKSQDLAPSGGTLLNLGDCYEKNGQPARAWAAFREAASRAATAGVKAAETAATERANKLEPKLLRLRIRLAPGADEASMEIRRDGARVKKSELDVDVPVDPGEHKVEVQAFQKRPWSKIIVVNPGTPLSEVVIPVLEPEANGGPSSAAAPSGAGPSPEGADMSTSGWTTQQMIGAGVAGAGVVALGAGAYFGLKAMSTNDDALSNCRDVGGTQRCTPTGLELTDDARSQALVSTILVPVGVVAIGAGAYLFFSAPKPKAAAVHAAPIFGQGTTGLALSGRF